MLGGKNKLQAVINLNSAQAVKIIRNEENISYNPHNINNTGENMEVPDDDDIYEDKVELGW